jgi:hypothetical protein
VNAERPTRATADGRAYLDLQNLARRDHRPTDEYVQFRADQPFNNCRAITTRCTWFVPS